MTKVPQLSSLQTKSPLIAPEVRLYRKGEIERANLSYQASLHDEATYELCSRTPEQLSEIYAKARAYKKRYGNKPPIIRDLSSGLVVCHFCQSIWLPTVLHTKPAHAQILRPHQVMECPSCHTRRASR